MKKTEKVKNIIEILKAKYPEVKCFLTYTHPYELLIAARLSAQCTDKRVNLVTPKLFERFDTIDKFADADVEEIAEYIKSCGLYKTKAEDLKGMCKQLRDDYNYQLPDTVEELTKLQGIGRKTANLIVGDIYNKPAVITDTHVIRISNRLGLTKSTNPAIVEKDLRKVLPTDESRDFCHRVVKFGRDVCIARNPKCEECELKEYCTIKK